MGAKNRFLSSFDGGQKQTSFALPGRTPNAPERNFILCAIQVCQFIKPGNAIIIKHNSQCASSSSSSPIIGASQ